MIDVAADDIHDARAAEAPVQPALTCIPSDEHFEYRLILPKSEDGAAEASSISKAWLLTACLLTAALEMNPRLQLFVFENRLEH